MPFTTILCKSISSKIIFFTKFIKTPHVYENMKIWPRNSTKETGWGNNEEPGNESHEMFSYPLNMPRFTLLPQRATKQLMPLYASLFDLLPPEITVNTDIWLSGLKHYNIFKHFIFCFKSICNPVLFATPHNL